MRLHPGDLADLISIQMQRTPWHRSHLSTLGGGRRNRMSLAQLTAWCDERFGPHAIEPDTEPRDVRYPVVRHGYDDASRPSWDGGPNARLPSILEEIADHAPI